MRIIYLSLIFLMILLESCMGKAKSPSKEIYNKEFDWTIEIPEGFESVPAKEWMKMQNRGADAVEKTYDAKVENRTTTIFAFRSDQFHYFESNYQPFDSATDGNYLETFHEVNSMLYGTFEAQMPDAILDSSSSEEIIDGKLFQTYKVNITIPNKITMEFLMFSRLFGNKEFSVNIMTVDKKKQKILLDAWRNSKFGSK